MDFVNLPLLAAAGLVFVSVLTGVLAARLGFSVLLVFLFAGILVGEDGLVGYRFDDYTLSFWVGNVALAVILLDGGMRTSYSTFRTGLRPAAVLATLGVLLTAAITALAGMWLMGLDWRTAALLGAIVGSTDAAAVFALLTRSGVVLNERVATTLEIESGVNDPMAVYLTIAFIALLAPGASSQAAWSTVAITFIEQFGLGALAGVGFGFAVAALVRRAAALDGEGGILALLIGAGGLSVFAATGLIGGSGFLAVYLFGLIVANRAPAAVASTLVAMDGYAWLAQASMFLLLGLLVTPSAVIESLVPGLGVAAVLMFVARPVSVWLCLLPFRFQPGETWFISWVGLRGAVPIVLAMFPLLAGTPQAGLLFNVAFVIVLMSLLLQGTTIGLLARRTAVALPDPGDERHVRAVFRDFVLEPSTPIDSICQFYGLPVPADGALSLAAWMAAELRRPPVVGDNVSLGPATFVVREMQSGTITSVGLGLQEMTASG